MGPRRAHSGWPAGFEPASREPRSRVLTAGRWPPRRPRVVRRWCAGRLRRELNPLPSARQADVHNRYTSEACGRLVGRVGIEPTIPQDPFYGRGERLAQTTQVGWGRARHGSDRRNRTYPPPAYQAGALPLSQVAWKPPGRQCGTRTHVSAFAVRRVRHSTNRRWCQSRESNPVPAALHAAALPVELPWQDDSSPPLMEGLGRQDSNPDFLSRRQACYRYTTPTRWLCAAPRDRGPTGLSGRTRTSDLLVRNQVRCPLRHTQRVATCPCSARSPCVRRPNSGPSRCRPDASPGRARHAPTARRTGRAPTRPEERTSRAPPRGAVRGAGLEPALTRVQSPPPYQLGHPRSADGIPTKNARSACWRFARAW